MQNLINSLHGWFLVAQILGLITIGFEFASYQIKNKSKYFLVTGIGSLFWMLMFVSMGIATGMDTQFSLIIAAIYSTFRNLVFWQIFKHDTPKSQEAGLIFLLIMVVIAITAGTATVINAPAEVRWLHVMGLVTALGFVIGQYLPGVHYVRISVVIYALVVMLTQTPINILYGDFRWNVIGIAIESTKIISVALFYIKYSKEPRKPIIQLAKP